MVSITGYPCGTRLALSSASNNVTPDIILMASFRPILSNLPMVRKRGSGPACLRASLQQFQTGAKRPTFSPRCCRRVALLLAQVYRVKALTNELKFPSVAQSFAGPENVSSRHLLDDEIRDCSCTSDLYPAFEQQVKESAIFPHLTAV